jgi:hypothetical protein
MSANNGISIWFSQIAIFPKWQFGNTKLIQFPNQWQLQFARGRQNTAISPISSSSS